MSSPHADELAGCRILVTAQRRAAELGAALERRGATVEHAPMLSSVPHVDDELLLERTRELIADPPGVVVATTGVGVTGWVEAADAAGLAPDLLAALSRSRLVARGPKARGALLAVGLHPDWVAESETAAEIRDELLRKGVAGIRIAVQHHGAGSDGLDEAFAEAGADVVSLVIYRWAPPTDPGLAAAAVRRVATREFDAVAFTSAPGAAAFLDIAAAEGVALAVLNALRTGHVLAAAVGSTTAGPLRDVGIEPLVPERFRMGALVRAIVHELSERSGVQVRTVAGDLRLLRSAAVLNGEVLTVSPSALGLLRLLAEASGDVVPRARILRALPGSSTDPHAADVAVARLRESLVPNQIVRTVVKRGYRLDVVPEHDYGWRAAAE